MKEYRAEVYVTLQLSLAVEANDLETANEIVEAESSHVDAEVSEFVARMREGKFEADYVEVEVQSVEEE